MMTDPIADMLTRIRNASLAHKREAEVPYSKIKMGIAKILERAGYVSKAEEVKDARRFILITLKYHGGGQPAIRQIERVSKPGHRVYVKREELKPVLSGFGLTILSTPKGLLTDSEARKENVGGEVMCEVY